MGQHAAEQTGPHRASWQRALLPAWAAGILVFQVPFQLYYKLGNGGFGYNLMIGFGLIIAGIALLASATQLLRLFARGNHDLDRRLLSSTTTLLYSATTLFLLALLFGKPAIPYYAGLACLGVWIIGSCRAILRSERSASDRSLMVRLGARARAAARQPWPFNGIFWLLVFLGLVAKDFYTITDIEGASGVEIASLVAGRLVTNASLTLALVLAVQA
ncbi:MAG: hypothetical protein ACR2RV_26410, partial [Verrucomicrobiales bacterium]